LPTERRNWTSRALIAAIYLLLSLGGVTMVLPFLITVTSSLSGPMDYTRYSIVPRSLYSRSDRFVRSLSTMLETPAPVYFPDAPAHWTSWMQVGDDTDGIDRFAAAYLAVERDPARLERWRRMAKDYAEFALDYDFHDTVCMPDKRDLAGFLEQEYVARYRQLHPDEAAKMSASDLRDAALELMCREWKIPFPAFFNVDVEDERLSPMHHLSWMYPPNGKYQAWERFKDAYRRLVFRPKAEGQWREFLAARGHTGPAPWPMTPQHAELWPLFKEFAGERSPATPAQPHPMKQVWLKHLDNHETKTALGLDPALPFSVADYNALFAASHASLREIPFPVPGDAHPKLKALWTSFRDRAWPRRLVEIRVTPELERRYRDGFRRNCKGNITAYNEATGKSLASFDEIHLEPRGITEEWREFLETVPKDQLIYRSAEAEYQRFLLAKYGSLAAVNAAYGWDLARIEQAEMPVAEACTVTFLNNEWTYYIGDLLGNYRTVLDFMFLRGRAFVNTIILCFLTILATLTVNPLCAYALSRYRLKLTEQILLFLLATMAFPGAVRAIPGFLLMKDLGLLNSYSALVLPGLASGMSIFILKGFFDGLPRELYEAASLDGASEFQMFRMITLPMSTPILAVNTLGAFLVAYNSWDWALLVCQKEEYWTLSVWLYQMQTLWVQYPYIIMAGFVLASLPTAIVFIGCQKVIMRGIVLPAMK
jgi:ABC-type glycerol-3-phosphate transport system permease component